MAIMACQGLEADLRGVVLDAEASLLLQVAEAPLGWWVERAAGVWLRRWEREYWGRDGKPWMLPARAPKPLREMPMALACPTHARYPRRSGMPASISILVPSAQARRQSVSTAKSPPRASPSIKEIVFWDNPARAANSTWVHPRSRRACFSRAPIPRIAARNPSSCDIALPIVFSC